MGKGLALTQIRLVAAKLLERYQIRFAPGTDTHVLEREMRDQMTAQVGRIPLLFLPRARDGSHVVIPAEEQVDSMLKTATSSPHVPVNEG